MSMLKEPNLCVIFHVVVVEDVYWTAKANCVSYELLAKPAEWDITGHLVQLSCYDSIVQWALFPTYVTLDKFPNPSGSQFYNL